MQRSRQKKKNNKKKKNLKQHQLRWPHWQQQRIANKHENAKQQQKRSERTESVRPSAVLFTFLEYGKW